MSRLITYQIDTSGETCEQRGHDTVLVQEDETGATHDCRVCGAEIIEEYAPESRTLIARCDGTPEQIAAQLEQIAARLRNGANGCYSTEDAAIRDDDGEFVGVWSMTDTPNVTTARIERLLAHAVTLPND